MRLDLERRVRALEQTIIVKPLPPAVVYVIDEDGASHCAWIGWFDHGVCKAWNSRDGLDMPEALQLQIRGYDDRTCGSLESNSLSLGALKREGNLADEGARYKF